MCAGDVPSTALPCGGGEMNVWRREEMGEREEVKLRINPDTRPDTRGDAGLMRVCPLSVIFPLSANQTDEAVGWLLVPTGQLWSGSSGSLPLAVAQVRPSVPARVVRGQCNAMHCNAMRSDKPRPIRCVARFPHSDTTSSLRTYVHTCTF